MRKRLVPLGVLLGGAFALAPVPAAAHGIGQRYDLPVPLWLYLYGAASAVVLSFVLIALFLGERGRGHGYPRFDLARVRPLHAVLASRALALAAKAISLALFVLVIATGLFGSQSVGANIAPTLVWVVWWVGFGLFVALVGNVWPLIDPWRTAFDLAGALARRLGLREGIELHEPYPARLGQWPALFLYGAFVWLENVFAGGSEPRPLAIAIAGYSLLTWAGMVVYGRDVWLRHGEAFSVLYGVLGRFAPIERRTADRDVCRECTSGCAALRECVGCEECLDWAPEASRLALRPPGAGLLAEPPLEPGRVAFVVFMLASVSFDGLSATPAWMALYFAVRGAVAGAAPALAPTLAAFQTVGLVIVPLAFATAYRVAVGLTGIGRLARLAGLARAGGVAPLFVHSLVPIAIAYQLAHYLTLLVGYSWTVVPLLSDPFGWGWDLIGTKLWSIEPVLSGAVVWYFQVGVIVAGHVLAVYLAHVVALRTVGAPRAAARSQVPMLGLMVAYTVSSLWILSQGVVSESAVAWLAP